MLVICPTQAPPTDSFHNMCHVSTLSHVNFGTLTPQTHGFSMGFPLKKSLIQEPPMVRCSNVTKSNQTEAEAEQYDGFSDPPGVFIGRPWEMAWEMAHRNQWLTY